MIDKNPLNVLLGIGDPLCIYPNAKNDPCSPKRHAVDNLPFDLDDADGHRIAVTFLLMRGPRAFAYRQYLRLVQHLEQVLPEDRFRTFTYEGDHHTSGAKLLRV